MADICLKAEKMTPEDTRRLLRQREREYDEEWARYKESVSASPKVNKETRDG